MSFRHLYILISAPRLTLFINLLLANFALHITRSLLPENYPLPEF